MVNFDAYKFQNLKLYAMIPSSYAYTALEILPRYVRSRSTGYMPRHPWTQCLSISNNSMVIQRGQLIKVEDRLFQVLVRHVS